ncbi:MAG: hypothetical protein JXL97_20445 [Bacteroidales bacterium]|nr:hypothetical protein [Bacteroidales bacterium]
MKRNLKKIGFGIMLAVFIASSFSLSSCKKKVAPVLPPEGAFVMADLSEDGSKSLPEVGSENFLLATGNVFVWTVITTVAMVVPVTAYTSALQQEPHHVSGNKWVWEYQFGIGFKIYTVQLFGETVDNEVNWELHVSLTGEIDDFVWYTGTHNLEGSAGQWIIYKSPSENHEFIQIDWTRNSDDETGTIKYTNIEAGNAENGGYIYYGNDQAGEFNTFFDIFNKGENNLIEIDYNSTYHNGRIKNEKYYLDDLWHCWNENYIDDYCDTPTK